MIGFSFFVDELIKEGSDYYQRNRGQILAKQRAYRANNAQRIALKQKAYRRKVKSGSIRQRSRQQVGHSFIYTGYK